MPIDPKKKTVLITGSDRGIGLALAHSFLTAGVAKLYATALEADWLNDLVLEHPGKVVALALDLTKADTILAAAEATTDVDIVVNNGGILTSGDPMDPQVFDKLELAMDVNAKGLLRIAQAFEPALKANQGALVQINSIMSLRNIAEHTTYCISKAASYSITQGLRDHFAPRGIEVYSVHPGPINTALGDQAGFVDAPGPKVVSEAVIEALKAGTFHCFPDEAAQQFWRAYKVFATHVVEAPVEQGRA